MSEKSYVELENGVQKWLYLANPRNIEKVLIDPLDGQKKVIPVQRWDVLREDRRPVQKVYDVTSVKHQADLTALWKLGVLDTKEVGITRFGTGFQTKYSIETRPLQG